MSRSRFDITPETKVGELLREFPELEEVLYRLAPSFAALKNPVLRRTVARVTSLQQAAKVGNINAVEMVDSLRQAAGIELLGESFSNDADEQSLQVAAQAPVTPVTFTLDVRPIIDAGDHPKDVVMTEAEKLKPGECLLLVAPFPPAPLITLLQKRGFRVTMLAPEKGLVKSYVER